MSFMEPEIYEGRYLEVETSGGVFFIPRDALLLDGESCVLLRKGELDLMVLETRTDLNLDEMEIQQIRALLAQYVDGRPLKAIWRNGLLGRLSAPGYLDATEWEPYDSEEDALQDLLGEEQESDEESDSEGASD